VVTTQFLLLWRSDYYLSLLDCVTNCRIFGRLPNVSQQYLYQLINIAVFQTNTQETGTRPVKSNHFT